jgi:hypothetical protein
LDNFRLFSHQKNIVFSYDLSTIIVRGRTSYDTLMQVVIVSISCKYLEPFVVQKNLYCMGFQNGGVQTKDGKDMVLLGDLVLSNKLVLYDLENQAIGWADYNCKSLLIEN